MSAHRLLRVRAEAAFRGVGADPRGAEGRSRQCQSAYEGHQISASHLSSRLLPLVPRWGECLGPLVTIRPANRAGHGETRSSITLLAWVRCPGCRLRDPVVDVVVLVVLAGTPVGHARSGRLP